jgi:Mg2+/Co2+ transporter CorB
VHVLLGNENGRAHIAQATKKFTNALHDDGGKPLAGLVQEERNRVPHQGACDRFLLPLILEHPSPAVKEHD